MYEIPNVSDSKLIFINFLAMIICLIIIVKSGFYHFYLSFLSINYPDHMIPLAIKLNKFPEPRFLGSLKGLTMIDLF